MKVFAGLNPGFYAGKTLLYTGRELIKHYAVSAVARHTPTFREQRETERQTWTINGQKLLIGSDAVQGGKSPEPQLSPSWYFDGAKLAPEKLSTEYLARLLHPFADQFPGQTLTADVALALPLNHYVGAWRKIRKLLIGQTFAMNTTRVTFARVIVVEETLPPIYDYLLTFSPELGRVDQTEVQQAMARGERHVFGVGAVGGKTAQAILYRKYEGEYDADVASAQEKNIGMWNVIPELRNVLAARYPEQVNPGSSSWEVMRVLTSGVLATDTSVTDDVQSIIAGQAEHLLRFWRTVFGDGAGLFQLLLTGGSVEYQFRPYLDTAFPLTRVVFLDQWSVARGLLNLVKM